jgi:hypothetical protein
LYMAASGRILSPDEVCPRGVAYSGVSAGEEAATKGAVLRKFVSCSAHESI